MSFELTKDNSDLRIIRGENQTQDNEETVTKNMFQRLANRLYKNEIDNNDSDSENERPDINDVVDKLTNITDHEELIEKLDEYDSATLAQVVIAFRALEGENAIRARFAGQALLDKELEEAGLPPTLKLSIGQPHLDPSPVQDLALADLVNKQYQKPKGYSPSKGLPQYVRYATQLFNARNPGLDAEDKNVLLTNGGTGALAAMAAVLLEPGKKVLFPVPGFVAQIAALKGYGGEVVQVSTHDTGFKLTPDSLERSLRDNPETAFVVFNDITNPTGGKYTEAELKALGDVFRKPEFSNVLVFLDETYHDLALGENAKFFLEVNPDLKNRVVIEYSTAKDIVGDPGLRGGMVYAPMVIGQDGKEINLAEKMAGQQLNMITAVPTLVQYIVSRAIEAKLNIHYNEATKSWENGGRYHEEHVKWEAGIKAAYAENLEIAKQQFASVGMPTLVDPGGAFFLFIDGSKFIGREIPNEITSKNGLKITNLHDRVGSGVLDTDIKVANYMALVANMVVVEGSPFGMPAEQGAFRVSVANHPEKLLEIADRVNYAEQFLGPKVEKQADVSAAEDSTLSKYWTSRDASRPIVGDKTAALANEGNKEHKK